MISKKRDINRGLVWNVKWAEAKCDGQRDRQTEGEKDGGEKQIDSTDRAVSKNVREGGRVKQTEPSEKTWEKEDGCEKQSRQKKRERRRTG